MPVVVFAGRKGGCGKTTGSVNFAAWLARKYPGEVCLLDTDPNLGAFDFVGARDASGFDLPKIQAEQTSGNIGRTVESLANTYTWVVVDTPGLDSIETNHALARASVAVFPIKNSMLDQKTLPQADMMIQKIRAHRPDFPGLVYLNECPPGVSGKNRRAVSAQRLAGLTDVKLLEGFTTSRNAFTTSPEIGIGVVESDDRKAADEFSALAQEIHDYAIR